MRRTNGFTLVELMVTVVIIGVLAAVAGTAYTKYFARARVSEVTAFFGDIRNKEEAYRTEFSMYLSTTVIGETDVYPALVANNEPNAKPFLPAINTNWYFLGARPGRPSVYCGYNVIAGPPASWGNFGNGAFVQGAFTAVPLEPWWVAFAMCDNDNKPGTLYDNNNSTYLTWYNNTAVRDLNSGR